jgi:CBS domain-containing protein
VSQKVSDIMTAKPVALPLEATLAEAARIMRDQGIGDVLVTSEGRLCGLVTDRDIVVRGVAESRDATITPVSEICTAELATVRPDDDLDIALRLMRGRAIRRLPVVESGRPVGIVSVADLATAGRDRSVLGDLSADISRAPPNQ